MQTIAEEVVSSSGGGGKYITSGFSNYVGHSAIGLGKTDISNRDTTQLSLGLGLITTWDGYCCLENAFLATTSGTACFYRCTDYTFFEYKDYNGDKKPVPYAYAIVF